MLIWGNIAILLLYFHADAYFRRSCYFVKFQQSYDILNLWQARKHIIHPFNRGKIIGIYLNNTLPVSSIIFNRINEAISSPLLQEHRQRNEKISGKNNYSSKMFMLLLCLHHYLSNIHYAYFMLTLDYDEELNEEYDDVSCMTRDTGTWRTSYRHAVDDSKSELNIEGSAEATSHLQDYMDRIGHEPSISKISNIVIRPMSFGGSFEHI